MDNYTLLFDKNKELTSTQKKVYNVLKGMSKKFREVFPAIATLARLVGKSETTIVNAIKVLKKLKLISTVSRFHKNGRQTSNGYIILVQPEQEKPKAAPAKVKVAPLYKSFLKPLRNIKHKEMDERASDPDIPILEILKEKLKRLNLNGINVGNTYIPEIFPMLKRFFKNNLNPETVSIACDLFLSEYAKCNKHGGYSLRNPVGWFYKQFTKAIDYVKSKNYLLQEKGIYV